MPKPRQDLLLRFWAKVDQSAGPTACWPWRGAFNTPAGMGSRRPVFYLGAIWQDGRRVAQLLVYAPRFALSLTDGVMLDERVGLQACHRCGAPEGNCCNPDHLYWGRDEENRRDRYPPQKQDFGNFVVVPRA